MFARYAIKKFLLLAILVMILLLNGCGNGAPSPEETAETFLKGQQISMSSILVRKNKQLWVEQVCLQELAVSFETPFYTYS